MIPPIANPQIRIQDLSCCSLLANGEFGEIGFRIKRLFTIDLSNLASRVVTAVKKFFVDMGNCLYETATTTWDYIYDAFDSQSRLLVEQNLEPYRKLPMDKASTFTGALLQLEKGNCTPEQMKDMEEYGPEGILLFIRLLVRGNLFTENPPKFFENILDQDLENLRSQFERLTAKDQLTIVTHRNVENASKRVKNFYHKIDDMVIKHSRGSPPQILKAFEWVNWE